MIVLAFLAGGAVGAAVMWVRDWRHYAELREDRNSWEDQALTRATAAEDLADELDALRSRHYRRRAGMPRSIP